MSAGHHARHLDREYRIGPLRVAPLTPVIGADVEGIDLHARPTPRETACLAEAVRRHKVLFLRAPGLSLDEFVAFGRSLGPLQSYASGSVPRPSAGARYPEVHSFEYGQDARGREAFWHFDVLPSRRPARAALLRARVVPPVGGDTLFCDLAAVYESLPAAAKARLEGAVAVYDLVFERRLARFRGRTEDEVMALSPEPLQELPLVAALPAGGARVVYVNPAFLVGIKGMAGQEWQDVAADLRARIARPEFQCRHRWREDDVALWDNRACLHYAASDYWPGRRVMERVSVVDEAGSFLDADPEAAR